MQVAYRPDEISAMVSPQRTLGATTDTIRDIASLTRARPGDLSFLGKPKYRAEVAATAASAVLVPLDYAGQPRDNQVLFFVENPSAALAGICSRLEQALWPRPAPGVHPSACVAPGARVDATATVGPLCVVEDGAVVGPRAILQASVFLGHHAQVGEGSWLQPGVVVAAECLLGRRVRLQPGVIVGADGFGYEFVQGRHEKIPQVGIVVIGDDVEIGANSTLDRARFSRTEVGEGTKIDNLVQVGHNVVIGRHCILCSQVGISGSTTLEDYVILAGQVGVAGHITLSQGSKAGGQAGVTADLKPGAYVNGTPAIPFMLERRLQVLHQKLPELFKRVEKLEAGAE
ncbi:MAG: UDP-3-O-(3-hydroxymyristoyl)glucosamine N-acyltransferase [Opitutales bacterium]